MLNIPSHTKKQVRWLIAGGTFSKICIFSNIIWAPEGLKNSYYIFVFKFQFEWSTLVYNLGSGDIPGARRQNKTFRTNFLMM